MRKIAETLLAVVGVVLVVWAGETALMVWAFRRRNRKVLHLVKGINKQAVNPVMLRFSGRSGSSAIVHHVGRRTGTAYVTPVLAHQTCQGVIVPLPYGTNVDWLTNVRATGGAVVDLEGRSLEVDEPTVVDIDDIIGLLPAPLVRTVRFNRTTEAARLHVSGPAAAASA